MGVQEVSMGFKGQGASEGIKDFKRGCREFKNV